MIWTTRQQNLPGKPTQFLEDQINRIGWWISIDTGKSLTVSHLFDDSEALYVLLNGRDGTIVSIKNIRKNENDLAIISVDYGLTPYQRIATESDISIGDTVLADDGNAYQGEVLDLVDNQIITTLELVPGKSWLPLFDEQWVLIGINSSITEKDGSTVTYAQSITKPFLEELLSWGN